MSEEVKESLVKNIRRRMTPQPLKIRADIEMKCFQFDGVLHIKVLCCPSVESAYFSFMMLSLWLDFDFVHTCCSCFCRMPCGKQKLQAIMTVL